MSRTVYVNGAYVAKNEAYISVFDRGFLFADAVYEVTAVLNGKLIDFPAHVTRLRRSLNELQISLSLSDGDLLTIHRQLLQYNELQEGTIYMQISRGVADRDFAYPLTGIESSVVLFTQARTILDNPLAKRGAKVILVDDLRWHRRDIKTVQLLYASMAKMQAQAQGADDAWMVQDGLITEGSSNNAYIVTADGTIVTRQLSRDILHGITRSAVLECARQLQMKVEERAFSQAEAYDAVEAFNTAASSLICPVVSIDGHLLGDGKPGRVATQLREIYIELALKNAL